MMLMFLFLLNGISSCATGGTGEFSNSSSKFEEKTLRGGGRFLARLQTISILTNK